MVEAEGEKLRNELLCHMSSLGYLGPKAIAQVTIIESIAITYFAIINCDGGKSGQSEITNLCSVRIVCPPPKPHFEEGINQYSRPQSTAYIYTECGRASPEQSYRDMMLTMITS